MTLFQGSWSVSTTIPGYNSQIFVKHLHPQTIATVALEALQISSCSDYPSDGQITFNNMAIEDGGSPFKVNWVQNVNFGDCNQEVNLHSSSSVSISY